TVYPIQAVVTVSSDRNPSTAGQSVTFTAAVTISPQASSGVPKGSITFSIDDADQSPAALTGGQAVIRTTLAAGTHAISARYSGDSSYPSASGTFVQVVNAAAPSMTLSSSAPSAMYGQPVTLTAT